MRFKLDSHVLAVLLLDLSFVYQFFFSPTIFISRQPQLFLFVFIFSTNIHRLYQRSAMTYGNEFVVHLGGSA